MLEALKAALVDSFVGAIALGWLFAQGITRFIGAFIEPLSLWIARRQNATIYNTNSGPAAFPFQFALSQLLTALLLLTVAFALLRWLFYPAAVEQDHAQSPDPEQEA